MKKYASSDDDSQFDANSEKEQVFYLFIRLIMIGCIFDIPLIFLQILQGNEYFKQKKFNEAIDCYSRSIALSPNSVAFSNRAMAYLKIKRLVLYPFFFLVASLPLSSGYGLSQNQHLNVYLQ